MANWSGIEEETAFRPPHNVTFLRRASTLYRNSLYFRTGNALKIFEYFDVTGVRSLVVRIQKRRLTERLSIGSTRWLKRLKFRRQNVNNVQFVLMTKEFHKCMRQTLGRRSICTPPPNLVIALYNSANLGKTLEGSSICFNWCSGKLQKMVHLFA